MKNIFYLFVFEVKKSFRDGMVLYVLIMPLILAFVLRSFLPTLETAPTKVSVHASVPKEVVVELDKYLDVTVYEDKQQFEASLLGRGTIDGLYLHKDGVYRLVQKQDDPMHLDALVGIVLRKIDSLQRGIDAPIKINFITPDFLASKNQVSDLSSIGGAAMMLLITICASFIISLSLVEDKETQTISSLAVTSLTRVQYLSGKIILPVLIIIAQAALVLMILELWQVSFFKFTLVILSSLPLCLVLGLLPGSICKSQTAAIGATKALSMPAFLSVLGSTLLPANLIYLMWWSPFYWQFVALEGLITSQPLWLNFSLGTNLLIQCSACLLTTFTLFIFTWKKIKQGLDDF